MAHPFVRTSVNMSPEMYKLCKKHRIKFNEALRIGIAIILGDRGVMPYDNELNLYRKMTWYKRELEHAKDKMEVLQNGRT